MVALGYLFTTLPDLPQNPCNMFLVKSTPLVEHLQNMVKLNKALYTILGGQSVLNCRLVFANI